MSDVYFLYLFIHKNEPRFKLGVAADPLVRLKQLPEQINRRESLIAKCLDRAHAFKAEKTLHFLFRAFMLKDLPKGDGYTEWFNISVLNDVKVFCQRERDRLGFVTDFDVFPSRNLPVSKLSKFDTRRTVHPLTMKRWEKMEEGQVGIFCGLLDSLQKTGGFLGVFEGESNQFANIFIAAIATEAVFDAFGDLHSRNLGFDLIKSVRSIQLGAGNSLGVIELGFSFGDSENGGRIYRFAELVIEVNKFCSFLMDDATTSFFKGLDSPFLQLFHAGCELAYRNYREVMGMNKNQTKSYDEWFVEEIKKALDDVTPSVVHSEVLAEWIEEKTKLQAGLLTGFSRDQKPNA